MSVTAQVHTQCKKQHAPDENREIASFNTNNEFNRAINDEDIDFNIPGVPHSTVKQLHGASVRDLIQKIETYNKVNHSIPSAKNQKKWFMNLGTSNCVNYSIWNPKHSAKYVYHTGTSASSIARADTYCATERRRTRNLSSTPWISYRFRILHKERATPRAPLREEARGSRVLHREFAQEEMQEEVLLGYPPPVHPRREVPQEHV